MKKKRKVLGSFLKNKKQEKEHTGLEAWLK
jgi:hypothetical protein